MCLSLAFGSMIVTGCDSSVRHDGTPHAGHARLVTSPSAPQPHRLPRSKTSRPAAASSARTSAARSAAATSGASKVPETPLPFGTYIASASSGSNIEAHSKSPQESFLVYDQPDEGWQYSQGGVSGRYAWQRAASTRLCSDPYVIFFFIGIASGRYRGYFHVPDVSDLTANPVKVDGFGPEALVDERAHAGEWVEVGQIETTDSADGVPDLQIEASESTSQPQSGTTCEHSSERVAWDALRIVRVGS